MEKEKKKDNKSEKKNKKSKLGLNAGKTYEKPLSLYGMGLEEIVDIALKKK